MKKYCWKMQKFKFLYLIMCSSVFLGATIENRELKKERKADDSCSTIGTLKKRYSSKLENKQTPIMQPVLEKFDTKTETIETQAKINSCLMPVSGPTTVHPVKKNETSRIVTLSNNITKEMVTYKKHWSGHYCPEFSLQVNGVSIKDGESMQISLENDECDIEYRYNFKVGKICYRSGGELIKYKIPKNASHISSTFSWDSPAKLIMENAELISKCEI